MSNVKRERFNLSFDVEMLRKLRQIAHDRTMAGSYTGINELLEDAAAKWLESVPKSEQDNDGHKNTLVLSSVNAAVTLQSANSPQDSKKWVSHLLHILELNHPEAVPAIKSNLIAFSRLTDADGGRCEPPPRGPHGQDIADEALLEEGTELRGEKDYGAAQKRAKKRGGGRKAS